MNIALWIVQVLLAALFGAAGATKAAQPREKLLPQLPWAEDFSDIQVKIIGVLEFSAAVGLILPPLTGILPWLSPLAALGLVATMMGAILTHLRRKEYAMIVVNVVLMALALFVAYGRFVAEPF